MPIIYNMSTTAQNYEKIKSTINAMDTDYTKFTEKKIKASGNRLRNNLLNIKKLCDELRKQVLTEMEQIPTKPRKAKHQTQREEQEEKAP